MSVGVGEECKEKTHSDLSSRQKEWLNNKTDWPAQEEMEKSPDTQQTENAVTEGKGNFRGNDPELQLISFNSIFFFNFQPGLFLP